ncbi:MAG: hypothetical protein AAB573_03365 [Patescibacteria group bacterium]
MNGVPFLNLQYFYCLIYSFFGGDCSRVSITASDVASSTSDALGSAGNAATTTVEVAGGFWSWLWPFGDLGLSSVGSGGAHATGTFAASLASYFPESAVTVLLALGTLLSILWSAFSWFSYSASGILAMAIVSSILTIGFVRMKEWNQFSALPPAESRKSYSWSRWQDLLNEAMTSNPMHWRHAILEADGMLGELLSRLGYAGGTTSEMMRHVPDDAFVTVPQAWEAHRIKNFVAQRTSDYILTQREAFRTMKLYEQVFEEFDFI